MFLLKLIQAPNITNPTVEYISFKKLFLIYFQFLVTIIIIHVTTHLLLSLISLFTIYNVNDFKITANNKIQNTIGLLKFWFLAGILAPVYEELIFRLPLDKRRISLIISLLLLTYFTISSNSILHFNYYHIVVLVTMILSGCVFLSIKKRFLEKIEWNSFALFISSILFGCFHIGNFFPYNYLKVILLPLLLLPYFFSGFVLGSIRIKYGLLNSIFLHLIINNISLFMKFIFSI